MTKFPRKTEITLVIFFVVIATVAHCKLYYDIREVTNDQADDLTSGPENSLVLFTQDSCPKCNLLAMYFNDLVKDIKRLSLPVNLFRVDVSKNSILAARFEIDHLPSMKLILSRSKKIKNYKGDAIYREMVEFLKKNFNQKLSLIESNEELYTNSRKHILILCDSNSTFIESEELSELMELFQKEVNFTFTNSTEIQKRFKCNEGENEVVLYLNKERTRKYNRTVGSLKSWVYEQMVPLISDLSMRKLRTVIENKVPVIIFFMKYTDEYFTSTYNKFYQVAKNNSDYILFLSSVNSGEEVKNTLQEMYNLKPKDMPALLGLRFLNTSLVNYLLTRQQISNDTEIKSFVQNFLRGGPLFTNVLSESSLGKGREREGNIHLLFGNSAMRKIQETQKDVVLFLSNPLKKSSVLDFEVFNNASIMLKNNTNLAFAKIDILENELPLLEIRQPHPSVLFFPQDKRPSKKYFNFIVFEGNTTLVSLLKFLKESASYPFPDINLNLFEDNSHIHNQSQPLEQQIIDFSPLQEKIEVEINRQLSWISIDANSSIFVRQVRSEEIESPKTSKEEVEEEPHPYVNKETIEQIKKDFEDLDKLKEKKKVQQEQLDQLKEKMLNEISEMFNGNGEIGENAQNLKEMAEKLANHLPPEMKEVAKKMSQNPKKIQEMAKEIVQNPKKLEEINKKLENNLPPKYREIAKKLRENPNGLEEIAEKFAENIPPELDLEEMTKRFAENPKSLEEMAKRFAKNLPPEFEELARNMNVEIQFEQEEEDSSKKKSDL